jgi:uncharacterized protein YfaS (alpha-2-macroglobulin family)
LYWLGDTTLNINSYDVQPLQSYRVTIAASAKDRYGVPLVAPYSFSFRVAAPSIPTGFYVQASNEGTFSAYAPAQLFLSTSNVDHVDFSLYPLSPDEFRSLENLNFNERKAFKPSGAAVKSWTVQVADFKPDQSFSTLVTLGDPLPSGGTLAPGLYLLDAANPRVQDPQRIALEVTRTSLVVKRGVDEALVWAADLGSGEPVANAPVTVLNASGAAIARGTTTADGVFRTPAPRVTEYQDGPIYALLDRPDDTAFATQQWARTTYNPDVPTSFYPPVSERGYLYTDRPIYRAGETVHLRLVTRTDDDGRYSLPDDAGDVTLTVRDSRGGTVQTLTGSLDGFGSLSADVTLPQDAATGNYSIGAQSANRGPVGGGSFLVAQFRAPEFEVKLDSDKPEYVNGDTINSSAQADLFFGAPLSDAEGTYQVNASSYDFHPKDKAYDGFTFTDFEAAAKAQSSANAAPAPTAGAGVPIVGLQAQRQGGFVTDAQGHAAFSVPADLGDYPASQRFSITTTITDQNRQQVSATQNVIVHRASLYAGLRPQMFFATVNQALALDLVSVDTSGSAAPGVPLHVDAFLRTWKTTKKENPDGSTTYVNTAIDTPVAAQDLTTDQGGKATFSFTPAKGGQYRIVVTGRDARGNPFRTATFVYASSSEFLSWRVENDNRIALVADKTEYAPGDVAHVLVPAPFAGAVGLVSVERGRIFSEHVQPFPTNSTVVDVPITTDMAPTVYLSVALLKPGSSTDNPADFRSGSIKLTVSAEAHRLNVTLTPDRTTLGPGETVNFAVRTTDSAGNGVPAEVSLALVDQAVLSLADERNQAIFPAFWSQRSLGVASGGTLNVSLNAVTRAQQARATAAPTAAPPPPPAPARAATQAAGALPASGGGTEAVRSDFQNTAYWKADVQTDASGNTSVAIKMPDNLTTWRLAARGITADTAVGEGQATIQTTRDMVLRAVAARFFTAGDQTRLEALVTNRTTAPLDVTLDLSAGGLDVRGGPQRIVVQPGESTGAGWDAVASEGPPVKLTFSAQAATGQADGVQLTLPVNARSTPETVGSSGIVSGDSLQETVEVPGFANQQNGSISLQLNATLAGAMRQARLYLDDWLYQPADVLAYRVLARTAGWQASATLQQPQDVQDAQRRSALDAIKRLYALQTSQGGWAWWLPAPPNPDVTAQVLYALGEARQAGLAVDPAVLQRGVSYLAGVYNKPSDVERPPDANVRAFWALAMAAAGGGPQAREDALFAERATLGSSGRGALLLALLLDGADPNDAEPRTLAGDLASAGILSAAGTHWEDPDSPYGSYANSTRATSLVLRALVQLDPSQPLLDGAMRWLMGVRTNGYWRSLRETAIAIDAAGSFVVAREQPVQGLSFEVDLNGAPIGSGTFDDPEATADVKTPIAGLPTDTPLPVTIDKLGSGQLYYSLYLRYFAPSDEVSALSNGLTVAREYLPAGDDTPVDTVQAGDLVRVRVTVLAPTDLQFVQVEDPLPAGLEAVDSSLKTTDPNLVRQQQQENAPHFVQGPGGTLTSRIVRHFYFNPFDHVEVRDDRVALFATSLPRGLHQYIYYARATTPGTFKAQPPTAAETDFPDIFARGDSSTFTVLP